MRYIQFEQHIHKEIYNSTVSVDTDSLIENIHSVNDSNNKKRVFLIAFLFLSIISFSLFNRNKKPRNNSFLPVFENEKTRHENEKMKTKIKHDFAYSSKTKDKNITKNISNPATDSIISDFNKKPEHKYFLTDTNLKQNNTLNNITGDDDIKSTDVFEQTIAKSSIIETKQLDLKNEFKNKTISVNKIKNLKYALKSTNTRLGIGLSKLMPGDPTGCYSFGPKFRLNWLLGVEVGLLKPFKKFRYTGIEPSIVFDLRKEKEKPLEGLQAAIFTKVIREDIPFYAKLGISYTRITDRFKYNYSYIEHDTIQGIISITQSENGDTLTVIYGDIIRDINIERNLNQHYYFHLIDIPLTLGYSFDINSFAIEAELGAIFNIRTYTTGKILSAPNTVTPVKDLNYFKSSIGFSYFAGINILKSVSYKGEMFAGVRFRYIPNNFSVNTNPIKQNYNLLGFHIGYLYNLTKRSYD